MLVLIQIGTSINLGKTVLTTAKHHIIIEIFKARDSQRFPLPWLHQYYTKKSLNLYMHKTI